MEQQVAAAGAAAVGGALSTAILFPLQVVKTKLQAGKNGEEKKEKPAEEGVVKEVWKARGIAGFFDGVGYASLQSAVDKAAYFFVYTGLRRLVMRGRPQQQPSTLTDLVLGYLSEASHLPVTIPMEVLVTRIITSGGAAQYGGVVGLLQAILSKEGSQGLYKGMQAYVVLCLKPAIQYAVFNRVKAALLLAQGRRSGSNLGAGEAFALGALARAIATVIVFPYIRGKVIMMSRAKASAAESTSSSSGGGGADDGAGGGGGISSTSISTKEEREEQEEEEEEEEGKEEAEAEADQRDTIHAPPPPRESSSSPDSRAHTSSSHMGSRSSPDTNSGILGSLALVVRDEGPWALFRGLAPELSRGVLSAALMLMIKERAHDVSRSMTSACWPRWSRPRSSVTSAAL